MEPPLLLTFKRQKHWVWKKSWLNHLKYGLEWEYHQQIYGKSNQSSFGCSNLAYKQKDPSSSVKCPTATGIAPSELAFNLLIDGHRYCNSSPCWCITCGIVHPCVSRRVILEKTLFTLQYCYCGGVNAKFIVISSDFLCAQILISAI